jgi:hypothetical protein
MDIYNYPFEHVLAPDDGHIGLKHAVRKKNCEYVKVTDNYQQGITFVQLSLLSSSSSQTIFIFTGKSLANRPLRRLGEIELGG